MLIVLLLIVIGNIVALFALFQQIGRSRKVTTVVKSIESHPSGIIDITLETRDKSLQHQAGQFAFLRFAHSNEPHPFTIASSGTTPTRLRFGIKGLGDFTNGLLASVKFGQTVIVEGPYGEFKFDDRCERQVWIAGGIGITPFIAKLEYLSNNGATTKPVDFWYCTKGELDSQFPVALKDLCQTAGVTLHHLDATKSEFFSTDILKNKFHNLDTISIWFCGPLPLKDVITKGLHRLGFKMNNFHFDNFNMR